MKRGRQSDTWCYVATAMFALGATALTWRAASQPPESGEGDQAARAILQKADEARFPSQGFEVGVLIRNFEGKEPTEAREYKVLSKGSDNTIVMTIQPASERGQI